MRDRRRHPRRAVLVKMTAEIDGAAVPVVCTSLSAGGAFFSWPSRQLPVLGTLIALTWRPGGLRTPAVRLTVNVVWLAGGATGGPRGFGARWLEATCELGVAPMLAMLQTVLQVPGVHSGHLEPERGARFDFLAFHALPPGAVAAGAPPPPSPEPAPAGPQEIAGDRTSVRRSIGSWSPQVIAPATARTARMPATGPRMAHDLPPGTVPRLVAAHPRAPAPSPSWRDAGEPSCVFRIGDAELSSAVGVGGTEDGSLGLRESPSDSFPVWALGPGECQDADWGLGEPEP